MKPISDMIVGSIVGLIIVIDKIINIPFWLVGWFEFWNMIYLQPALCRLGLHDWQPNWGIDLFFHPDTLKCSRLGCSARKPVEGGEDEAD